MSKSAKEIDEIIKQNPGVDADKFREAQELLGELRKRGLTRPEYDLVPPYERRPVRRREEVAEEAPETPHPA